MGLFDKFLGQSDKSKSSDDLQPQPDLTPCRTEQELIERYGGIVLDKQLDFGEYIGTSGWNFNTTKGEISFGPDIVFPMQVLGTISHSSQTWLWAWANPKAGHPESVIQQALNLKKYGEDNGIDLLRLDTFDFTKEELHLMGLVGAGIFNSTAYYIADYGKGAMVMTIKSDKLDKLRKESHDRISKVFLQLISQFDMNHKLAFTHYLKAKGYTILEEGNDVTGTRNNDSITGQFDDFSRLISLTA